MVASPATSEASASIAISRPPHSAIRAVAEKAVLDDVASQESRLQERMSTQHGQGNGHGPGWYAVGEGAQPVYGAALSKLGPPKTFNKATAQYAPGVFHRAQYGRKGRKPARHVFLYCRAPCDHPVAVEQAFDQCECACGIADGGMGQ